MPAGKPPLIRRICQVYPHSSGTILGKPPLIWRKCHVYTLNASARYSSTHLAYMPGISSLIWHIHISLSPYMPNNFCLTNAATSLHFRYSRCFRLFDVYMYSKNSIKPIGAISAKKTIEKLKRIVKIIFLQCAVTQSQIVKFEMSILES